MCFVIEIYFIIANVPPDEVPLTRSTAAPVKRTSRPPSMNGSLSHQVALPPSMNGLVPQQVARPPSVNGSVTRQPMYGDQMQMPANPSSRPNSRTISPLPPPSRTSNQSNVEGPEPPRPSNGYGYKAPSSPAPPTQSAQSSLHAYSNIVVQSLSSPRVPVTYAMPPTQPAPAQTSPTVHFASPTQSPQPVIPSRYPTARDSLV